MKNILVALTALLMSIVVVSFDLPPDPIPDSAGIQQSYPEVDAQVSPAIDFQYHEYSRSPKSNESTEVDAQVNTSIDIHPHEYSPSPSSPSSAQHRHYMQATEHDDTPKATYSPMATLTTYALRLTSLIPLSRPLSEAEVVAEVVVKVHPRSDKHHDPGIRVKSHVLI